MYLLTGKTLQINRKEQVVKIQTSSLSVKGETVVFLRGAARLRK